MSFDYSQIPKPWPIEYARKRYIEGYRISLAELSKISGRGFEGLRKRCHSEGWVSERRRFHFNLVDKLESVVIAKLEETIGSDFSKVLGDHYKSARTARTVIDYRFQTELDKLKQIEDQIQAGEKTDDDLITHLRQLNPKELNLLAMALKALQGAERDALGLHFLQNLDMAIEVVQGQGYRVIDGEAFEALLTDEPLALPENLTD